MVSDQFLFNRIGKNINTKSVGKSRELCCYDADREDLTLKYKYPEGSQSERSAVWRAARMSTKPTIYAEEDSANVGYVISTQIFINFFSYFQFFLSESNPTPQPFRLQSATVISKKFSLTAQSTHFWQTKIKQN